ncbi:MAG: DUF177 domain-containing protein [Chromatiales bacterium]|nr:DUF177 domain-containing protein [Chromatiales bacterium]
MLPASFSAGELAELVARSASRSFEFPAESCARLARLVVENPAGPGPELRAEVRFREIDGGPGLELRLSGTLRLRCQRCLEPFEWPLDEGCELRICTSEAAAGATGEPFDTVVLNDAGQLPLAEVVEDELLAALPLSARHPDAAQCAPGAGAAPGDDGLTRPFAGLGDLLGRK